MTLSAYRVAPQMERKARDELRQAGIRAYVPMEVSRNRKQPVARGYVFASTKPSFAKHVRTRIGPVQPLDLGRLYRVRTIAIVAPARLFAVGDSIRIKDGPFADKTGRIISERGRKWWLVKVDGSTIESIGVQPRNMIHVDPG